MIFNNLLILLIKLQEFQNENNQTVVKSYYVARDFLVNWKDAFITCKASGMDLVELPTEAEADFFLNLCDQQQVFLKHQTFHLGGSYIGAGNDEFYWMTTEKRVNYKLKWAPGEPNNAGAEKCLTIFKSGSTYLFNNIVPNSPVLNFFCQHITNASSKLVVDPSKTEKLPNCNPALVEW